VPIADPLEAKHAFALQVFALVFLCSVLLVELLRAVSAGAFAPTSLINLVNVAISGVAVWWIRRGAHRRAARLFVMGFSVVLAVAISLGEFQFFRDGIKNLAVVLALAALLLGRRALWSALLVFVAAMVVAFARDHGLLGGAGPHPSPLGPNSVFLASVLGFCILAIVLDRFGLTVRETVPRREGDPGTGRSPRSEPDLPLRVAATLMGAAPFVTTGLQGSHPADLARARAPLSRRS
jgi:hypothetical protein